MKKLFVLLLSVALGLLGASIPQAEAQQCNQVYPRPFLSFIGAEEYSTPSGNFIRYKISVLNRASYPAELFAPSPDLPPCGLNTNSSRTWVNIYDNHNNNLYGFCALSSSDNLKNLWFGLPKGSQPPSCVTIKLKDRLCDKTYTSQNCVSVTREVCDGFDNDGDGNVDEGLTRNCSTACGSGQETCRQGAWLGCTARQPQTEVCDGLDNDCDGSVDESLQNTYYQDADEDGYGRASVSIQACSAPNGYVLDNTDCDDTDKDVHPGGDEIPGNGKDDDCVGGDALYSTGCMEEDSGELDIVGTNGSVGHEVLIPLKINNASNEVRALGFEVAFNPYILEYTGFEKGNLVESFTMFTVNPDPDAAGRLLIGGLSIDDPIPAGASGDLVKLKFLVMGGAEDECYPLQVENLKDDLAQISSTGACFCLGSNCNGDLNQDGDITPADALMAFKCYLGSGPCSDCTDVNQDGDVTPFDALCLFKKYLRQPSCLD